MSDELKWFIHDLVQILKEKYNDTMDEMARPGASVDHVSFQTGANFAYYDTLDLIEQQLISSGFTPDFLDQIVPQLGKRAE